MLYTSIEKYWLLRLYYNNISVYIDIKLEQNNENEKKN